MTQGLVKGGKKPNPKSSKTNLIGTFSCDSYATHFPQTHITTPYPYTVSQGISQGWPSSVANRRPNRTSSLKETPSPQAVPTAWAAAPAGDTTRSPRVCNGPFNASAVSAVKKSTCKHRAKIRAAGRKDHTVGFHLHSFGHNHHITEEPLAGKTPEKTKIISELPVRQKATLVQPEKVSRRPTTTDKAPELLPNPCGRSSNPTPTSVHLQSKAWVLPVPKTCLWFCFSQKKKKVWKPN